MTEEQLREVIRKELTSISKPKEKQTANEAAPKMKKDSSVQAVEDIAGILNRVENGMRSFNQSRYSNLKGEFKKVYKALDSLKSGMNRHSAIPESAVNELNGYQSRVLLDAVVKQAKPAQALTVDNTNLRATKMSDGRWYFHSGPRKYKGAQDIETTIEAFGNYAFPLLDGEYIRDLDVKFTGSGENTKIKSLKLESVVNEGPDYDEAMFNLDKIFGDDQESIETFQDIEDNGDWKDMVDYINNWGDESRLSDYGFRNNKHVEKFAKMIMNEKLNEKSRKWGDIAQLITKAWEESKNIPTTYAKDYAESLERMAKKNAKVFFKMYGDFTQEDFEEDMRYNLANESVTEARYKPVRNSDDIFFIWDDTVDNGREGISHGIESYPGGDDYSSFQFDSNVKGYDKFEKKVKELLKKKKWEYDFDGDILDIYESKVNEDGTDQLAKDFGTEVHNATSDGGRVKAQSTTKVWDDGAPVLKHIARAPKKSMNLPKKFRLVDDTEFGWWYFQVKGIWYGIDKDEYGTPPFDY